MAVFIEEVVKIPLKALFKCVSVQMYDFAALQNLKNFKLIFFLLFERFNNFFCEHYVVLLYNGIFSL